MNSIAPAMGDNAILLFLLLSIPAFGLAWGASVVFRSLLNNYLKRQYENQPNMSLDTPDSDGSETADYIALQLPNVGSFAFSLYLFIAPFLFAYLTLGLSHFQLLILPFSGLIQLVLALTSHSNDRKMQANISIALLVAWCFLVYFFIDLRSFF